MLKEKQALNLKKIAGGEEDEFSLGYDAFLECLSTSVQQTTKRTSPKLRREIKIKV